MSAALESVITLMCDSPAELKKCSLPASLKQDSVLALPAAWVMLLSSLKLYDHSSKSTKGHLLAFAGWRTSSWNS